MYEQSRVILPEHLWQQAADKQELKQLISQYMQRYPGYKVIEIGRYYAICEIGR